MEHSYTLLQPEDASKQRCQVLMENQLQCPERATYSVELENRTVLMCKHHFQVEQQIGTNIGDTYKLTNEPIPEFKQTQKS